MADLLVRVVLGLVVLTTVGGCSPRFTAPPLEWTRLADLPEPISNNAVASVVGADGIARVYSFMGITDPRDPTTITARCYRLEFAPYEQTLDGWERIADAPLWQGRARIAASAVAVGGRVFLIGGYTVAEDGTETTDPRLLEYLPSENTYIERARVPVEVDDTVAMAWGDRAIVLVSGWHGPDNSNTRAVQMYDLATDRWSQATPLLAPASGLFGHAGSLVGNQIVIVDGVAIKPAGDSRRFVISDVVTVGTISPDDPTMIEWEVLEAHPGQAVYRGAVSQGADDRLILIGGTATPYNIDGTGYDGSPAEPLDQVLVYLPSINKWYEEATTGKPATMDHRGLVALGWDRWAIIGGMVAPGQASQACWVVDLAGYCGLPGG